MGLQIMDVHHAILLYSSHDKEHNNAVALREFHEHSLNPNEPGSCLCLH